MIDFSTSVQAYSLWAMLGAGLLAFVSPCVLPMLPVYALYLLGGDEQTGNSAGWGVVLRRCLGLLFSFVLLFMLMGAGAGLVGSALKNANRTLLDLISGSLMILFGLWMLNVFPFLGLHPPSFTARLPKLNGFWSAALMGAMLVLAWTPCMIPTLSSAMILATSTQSATMWSGMLQLAVFGLGLCLPMLACMLLYQWLKEAIGWLRRHQLLLRRIGGLLMILYGLWVILRSLL